MAEKSTEADIGCFLEPNHGKVRHKLGMICCVGLPWNLIAAIFHLIMFIQLKCL